MVDGEVVSSTRIRQLISDGQVDRAHDFLGRWYELSGPVVTGNRIGRQLGFPTANLDLPPGKLVPPDGIYACWAGARKLRPAVTSIGVRPTFGNAGERKIEVHILFPQQDRAGGKLLPNPRRAGGKLLPNPRRAGGKLLPNPRRAGGKLPSAPLRTGLPNPRRPLADLLGRTLRLQFVKRLREERRFESREALVEQIRADCAEAAQVLRVR
jgi:FAD synthase